ncbi:hypothetical protein Aperf_G00000119157 [Anoplocephala perfoliata]
MDPLRSQMQSFPWDETVSSTSPNLPQPNSNNVPGNDVFQNAWTAESAHAASSSHRDHWNLNSELVPPTESSCQEVVVPSSNSQTKPTITTQGQSQESETPTAAVQSERPITPTSMTKLVEERINNPAKWGQRPIKQSTPWQIEQEEGDSVKSNRSRQESNVWRSEPPTGTQIWDALRAGPSIAPSNGSNIPRISPQAPSVSQPTAFSSGSNPWNCSSTGPFSSRPQFPPQGSSVFGPPGSIRRQAHGTNSSSASRHSNENIGLGPMGPRLNVWPASNEMASNNLGHRSNTWASMASRSTVDSHATNFLEAPLRSTSINGVPTAPQSMSSHRNSLLNYFMQLGFPRADVEDVLSTEITDIDQCLARLRSLQQAGFPGRGASRTMTDSRLLSSPNTSPDAAPLFGPFSNSQNAPFGRGNATRLATSARTNSMNQFGVAGVNNPCTGGGSFLTPTGGGDDLMNVSLSSLLGRPPAQPSMQTFLENNSTPMRNFHSQAHVQYVEELLAKKNAIQFQLNEFKDKPFMFASMRGRSWFHELNFQLQQIDMQLINAKSSGASAGVFGPASSANGFRISRHNSYNDTFGSQGSSSVNEENWLLIRDMPTSMSKLALECLLKCSILELHDFPAPGNYLLRLASAEVAREVKQRCDTQIVSFTPNVVIMSADVATGVLIEAAKLKNPVAAPAFV